MPHFAIVIRADGSVPFDDAVHPDHKALMIGHLVQAGHAVKVDKDTGAVRIEGFVPDDAPVQIKDGD